MDKGFGRLGQEDLQGPVHAPRGQVEVRLVRGHGDPDGTRPGQVRQLADGLLEHLALQDGTKDLGGGTEGGGQGSQVQGVFAFLQGVDLAGGEHALLLEGQAEDGLGGLGGWVGARSGWVGGWPGGEEGTKTYLVGHGEHGVGQAGGAKDLEALQEKVQVHREAASVRLALVGLEERGVDGALRLSWVASG